MRKLIPLLLGGAALFVAGCGPNCQSSCQRLYGAGSQTINGEGVEDCGIQRAGRSQSELTDTCLEECYGALDNPGEVGAFDPYHRAGSNESVTLDNERQAALWMQCISETSCENLQDGYCAPVW